MHRVPSCGRALGERRQCRSPRRWSPEAAAGAGAAEVAAACAGAAPLAGYAARPGPCQAAHCTCGDRDSKGLARLPCVGSQLPARHGDAGCTVLPPDAAPRRRPAACRQQAARALGCPGPAGPGREPQAQHVCWPGAPKGADRCLINYADGDAWSADGRERNRQACSPCAAAERSTSTFGTPFHALTVAKLISTAWETARILHSAHASCLALSPTLNAAPAGPLLAVELNWPTEPSG